MTASAPSIPSTTDELAESLFQPENNALLRAILENSSEGLAVVDPTGRQLYLNAQARWILGMGITDADPETWSERYGVFYPDTRTPCPNDRIPLYRALHGETVNGEDFFIRHAGLPAGRHFRVSARPVLDAEGKRLGAILYMRDTTHQRQAEAQQRKSEMRFQRIVEAAQEGIWTIDSEYCTTYVNRSLAQMLGYTVDEMMGRPLFDFVSPEDHDSARQHLTYRRPGDSILIDDFKLLRKEGSFLWTIISAGPVHDENGYYLGQMAMVTDVSRRREAEHQVRLLNEDLERRIAERTAQLEFSNQELEAFAYSVAHDLRAPLRSITNFTQALTEDCPGQLDSTGVDYVQRIRASAQRMSELIDGILALSRVNRVDFQEADVDLSALARSVAEQLQRWQPERAVRVHIQSGLVGRGDCQLLRLVLENLLGNAWKFTRERPMAQLDFGVLPDSGPGRVYFVRDNGAGFSMEYQNKLFGVFQRLHTQQEFEGTGVGLATVQRIVRRHGGRVWGEGQVGHGATFYFTLHEPSALLPPISRAS